MLSRSLSIPIRGRLYFLSLHGTRTFSGCAPRWEKWTIPQVILDELKDTSSIATPGSTKNVNERILILDPEKTTDRKFDRLVDDLNKDSGNKREISIKFLDDALSEDTKDMFILSIDGMNPETNEITISRFDSLCTQLTSSYSKEQLVDYITSKGTPVKKTILKYSKKKLASKIITDVWNIKKSEKFTTLDDFYIKKEITLTKLDMFLLLLQNGSILQYLSRAGSKISFDPKKDRIKFTGTESQVKNTEILLHSILNSLHKEVVNLSLVKNLFLKELDEFPLSTIGKNTEVFFNHIGDENYEMIALNESQIKRSKRLILWMLGYNKHVKESLILPEDVNSNQLSFFKDDDSLSWNNRQSSLFTLRNDNITNQNENLALDLARYSESNLMKEDLSFSETIEDAKSFPSGESKEKVDLEAESWKLLEELGIGSRKLDFKSAEVSEPKENEVSEVKEAENTEIPGNEIQTQIQAQSQSQNEDINRLNKQQNALLTIDQKEQIYQQLTDLSFVKDLNGLPSNDLNEPIFTVTLGNILFEGPKSTELIPKPPNSPVQDMKYKFNSNIQLLSDKICSLPPYNQAEQQQSKSLAKDPHNYVIQLKFLPLPYFEKLVEKNLEEQIKYPPVEIWIDLNEKSIPDIETMHIATVEAENNCYVSFPKGPADMKVCCQVSGNVLSDNVPDNVPDNFSESLQEANESSSDSGSLDNILNTPSSRYARFNNQPGIAEFLEKSKLDFSGRIATSIAPYIDLIINGETVRYYYINVSYRRQIELAFPSEQGSRLIQYNIVEGGFLGGRKIEVNLIGNMVDPLSKPEFFQLLDDSTDLINQL